MFFQETLGNNFRECGWEDGASTVARLRGTRNLNGRHNRVKLHAHQTQEVCEGGGGFTGARRPWDGDGVGVGLGWLGVVHTVPKIRQIFVKILGNLFLFLMRGVEEVPPVFLQLITNSLVC